MRRRELRSASGGTRLARSSGSLGRARDGERGLGAVFLGLLADAYARDGTSPAGRRQSHWKLRAAMSLSRLRRQQGKRKEAHDLLAEVYAWFTEGFDTADLQDAKALLEELA
jgi:hypothetical protein